MRKTIFTKIEAARHGGSESTSIGRRERNLGDDTPHANVKRNAREKVDIEQESPRRFISIIQSTCKLRVTFRNFRI